MSKKSSPIGVFDSGLGGLSILQELALAMPAEDFIYLGDIARLPYGTKSQQVVAKYSNTCANFLFEQGIKALVVACNTATAMALPQLQSEFDIPVLGVVEPGVQACINFSSDKPVLVLATEGTVKSEAYLKEFRRQGFKNKVEQLHCPLLVPLAEEGWFDNPVTTEVIRTYLSTLSMNDFGLILLGCTHYPLLKESFKKVLGKDFPILHGAKVLAQQIRDLLASKDLLQENTHKRKITFFSTDQVKASFPILTALFKDPVSFSTVDL